MKQNWLKLEDIDDGTKERTLARALTSAGVAVAVWKVVFNGVFEATGNIIIAAVVATVVVVLMLAVDTVTTYKNNDYTTEAMVGTEATRLLKEDPTAVVAFDGNVVLEDADMDDEGMDETDEEGDEKIEEGE